MNSTAPETMRTQAFILAGGQGERLHPLTVARPKPAVSFGGAFRIIDFTLSNCLHSGLDRVSLLTQYKHEELHRHVREGWWDVWNNASRHREPLTCLSPSSGKRYRGTADSVFQNAELVSHDCDSVLILSGDHIYQMDYRDLLRQHAETDADLTIATAEYPLNEASRFGVVEVDSNFRITGFEEKPANPRSLPADPSKALVSMGIYVFKKSVLLEALEALCGSGLGHDFGHDLIPALIRSVKTFAYDFKSYWRDIGTIDAYYAASMDLTREEPLFALPAAQPASRLNKLARLRSDAEVSGTVLSPAVRIGAGATIMDSVLMPGVRVGKGAKLHRVIVEEGVHIPDGLCAGFDVQHDRQHHTVTASGVVVISKEPVVTKVNVARFVIPKANTACAVA